MSNERSIKDAIKMLSDTHTRDWVAIIPCEVISVSETDQTMDVKPIGGDADTMIPDVSLVLDDGDGDCNIPLVGSTALVLLTTNGVASVVMCSDLEKKYIITKSITQLNDGTYGGLVRVQPLLTKINALENTLNTFITTFNAHTHSGVSSGGATSGITTAPGPPVLTPTQITEIENQRITHGI